MAIHSWDLWGPVIGGLPAAFGADPAQLGRDIGSTAQIMLPDLSPLWPGGQWAWVLPLVGGLAGIFVGPAYLAAAISAARDGRLGPLITLAWGSVAFVGSGTAIAWLYGQLREPMITSVDSVIGAALSSLLGSGDPSFSAAAAIALFAGVTGAAGSAGALGMAMYFLTIAVPFAGAACLYRGTWSYARVWLTMYLGVFFSPMVIALGIVGTSIISGSQGTTNLEASLQSYVGVIAFVTSLLASFAIPWVILGLLARLGINSGVERGSSGPGAMQTAANARMVLR